MLKISIHVDINLLILKPFNNFQECIHAQICKNSWIKLKT